MKQLIKYIQEGIKLSSKSKVNIADERKEKQHEDFVNFFNDMNKNPFGESHQKIENINDSIIGSLYEVNSFWGKNPLGYILPLYVFEKDKQKTCAALYIMFSDSDEINTCELGYVMCDIKVKRMHVESFLSKNKYIEKGKDIYFEDFIDIMKKIYDDSQHNTFNEFDYDALLNKYK